MGQQVVIECENK